MDNTDLITKARELCDAARDKKARGSIVDSAALSWAITQNSVPQLCDALETMTTRAEKAEAENRWIQVEERLPEDEDGEVLVIASGKPHGNITLDGAYVLATYSRPEGWILDEYPEWGCANVTHWRPLPEPPKEAAP